MDEKKPMTFWNFAHEHPFCVGLVAIVLLGTIGDIFKAIFHL